MGIDKPLTHRLRINESVAKHGGADIAGQWRTILSPCDRIHS